MKTISLKIDDAVFSETEKILLNIEKPRNKYINEAIAHYNKLQSRKMLEKKLKRESYIVQDNSLAVLRDFDGIDYED